MLWLLWYWKIEWGNYVLIWLRKMKQLTIYRLTFWTVMFFLWINFDLLYCYDISLEKFTESIFFTFFFGGGCRPPAGTIYMCVRVFWLCQLPHYMHHGKFWSDYVMTMPTILMDDALISAVSRSKLQQDPVSLELENLEETFRTGPRVSHGRGQVSTLDA